MPVPAVLHQQREAVALAESQLGDFEAQPLDPLQQPFVAQRRSIRRDEARRIRRMPRVIAKHVVQDHGWRRGVEQVGTRTSMAGLSEVVSHAQRRTKPEGCNSRGMLQAGKARPVSRSERAQARLDLCTPGFEERRQRQGLAQVSMASSVAKPGPSVAISKRMPPGSRK